MPTSSGKMKIRVTPDNGEPVEFTCSTSRDRRYIYVSLGSRTYRRFLKQGDRDDEAVAAAAIRLILDKLGG